LTTTIEIVQSNVRYQQRRAENTFYGVMY
jgi:hypothetical protein